jgi:hypothetical protein
MPAGQTTVAKVSTSITQRGVTVSIIRVVLHTDGPPEMFIDFANRSGGRTLELNPQRIVVLQGGRRIVGQGASLMLAPGASAHGSSVTLPGFRLAAPYTLTATVTIPESEVRPPKRRNPLRFRFGFGAVPTS